MTKLRDVVRHARSKNAGPFWITIDLMFRPDTYKTYHDSPAIGPKAIAALYGVAPENVKHTAVEPLHTVKISFPRATPQGGMIERDLHSGQQYVRLLDVEMD
jgi:hypothetical protein